MRESRTYVFSDEHNCDHAYVRLADHGAALRRAKAEGLREGARLARWHAVCAFEAHPAAALERAATDIESVAKQLLDARAAQIEEGE